MSLAPKADLVPNHGEMTVKWLWNGCEMIMKWLKWLWNDCEMIVKWLWNGFEMAVKWLWNDCEMAVKWLWNDCEMTVKWLWNDCEMTVKWLWNDYEMTVKCVKCKGVPQTRCATVCKSMCSNKKPGTTTTIMKDEYNPLLNFVAFRVFGFAEW